MILPLPTPVVVTREADRVIVDNGKIRLTVEAKTGLVHVAWGDTASIGAISGEVRLTDGRLLKTTDYPTHTVETKTTKDKFGTGVQLTFRHRSKTDPEARQVFWVYEDRPETITRLDLFGSKGTNHLAPLVTEKPVVIKHEANLNALFVPWDNDMYVRYRSDGWGEDSYEVGALYDDATRRGIVVGSLDHDLWKSAVNFKKDGGLKAYAGATGKHTHDTQPHGIVKGKTVRSPRMLVALYDDWRAGLERYGDLNALVKPPLPWKGEVPFGWNSWSAHKAKVNATHARAATDFVKDLKDFRSGGTAYVNFDSFWDNLKPEELKAFVEHAHAQGLKAGIYWTPFACWGGLDNPVEKGSPYKYRDILLKDDKGALLPQLDGAYPIDPTHPGSLARTDATMKRFVDLGFDYVKLDFLSHGALEGARYDSDVPTGTAAYNVGMRRIVDDLSPRKIGRPFFISLSIAPQFPHGLAHSRRISCDVFANIGASEYLLNSTNYGWWTADRLYKYNDPDHTVVYQPMDEQPVTEAEARTRFTASVVSGGLLLQGDDLTNPEARERVRRLFSNPEVLALARRTPQFRPVEGTTGSKAGDAFVWHDGPETYVAAFNFSKDAPKRTVLPLARLGVAKPIAKAHDLWTGADLLVDGDLALDLPPMACALVRL